MDQRIADELNIIKDIVLQTVPVEQIFLFGSYAGGSPHQDSDLDIYVVMPDTAQIREIDAMNSISHALYGKISMPVDVIVSRRSRFEARKSAATLERLIVREGLVLYG